MKTLIKTKTNEYTVFTGRNLLSALSDYLPDAAGKKVMVVTDDNVARHHLQKVLSVYPDAYVYMIEPGENSKSLEHVESICNTLAKRGFTRHDYLFALGGGVVGDLTGFVSSIYMRGIPYVQIPTSLLAGIDSSVGGKTAVNIAFGKNLVGRVYPPSAVVFDLDTLSTLPKEIFLDGLGEAIKYAVLDKDIFELMEKGDLDRDLEELVDRCVRYKQKIVEQDENESGLRRLLNLGHTLGHAVEREMGLGKVTHGSAVAMGLYRVVKCCRTHGYLSDEDAERIFSLYEKYHLPKDTFIVDVLSKHFAVDKKTENDVVSLVTVHGIGDCRIEPMTLEKARDFLTDKIRISPCSLSGEIAAIPSKSYAHRILLCAALSEGRTEVTGIAPSDDVLTTLRCVENLGATVVYDGVNTASVTGGKYNASASFDCGESGSTLRFLLPIAAALGIESNFSGHGKLPERPLGDLIATLRACGVRVSDDKLPLTLSGKPVGEVEIDGSLSSQYVTGLLIALSIFPEEKTLRVVGKKVSAKYVDITLEVLQQFGVTWEKTEVGYKKSAGKLRSPGKIEVEGDWSNAAFFLAAGVLGSDPVTVKNLRYPTEQGDAVIVDYLRTLGGKVDLTPDGATAYPSDLSGAGLDLTDCPDLAPILSVVASCAVGDTVLFAVDRLKIKESDRLESIIKILNVAGISAETDGTILRISGKKPSSFSSDGMGDHRMVMSQAILATLAGGTLTETDAVNKSYPGFFADFAKLGGKYVRI